MIHHSKIAAKLRFYFRFAKPNEKNLTPTVVSFLRCGLLGVKSCLPVGFSVVGKTDSVVLEIGRRKSKWQSVFSFAAVVETKWFSALFVANSLLRNGFAEYGFPKAGNHFAAPVLHVRQAKSKCNYSFRLQKWLPRFGAADLQNLKVGFVMGI